MLPGRRDRRGLQLRLGSEPGMEVLAAVQGAEGGLRLAHELLPDLVLLDGRLAEARDFDVVPRLVSELPRIAVVMLSLSDDAVTRSAVLRFGVQHFVSKHDGDAALMAAIRSAAHVPASETREAEGGRSSTAITSPTLPAPSKPTPGASDDHL
jgi:DNA-binding NarL/FixJ family response regulator